ncbi:SNF2-related protein [Sphingomonas abietis]|uniref:DEAD/DEAH box helicase n=1 Tax=Sphingomonas abietis TaxID=3012344 RepID=A0ABY7NT32_9SPHN|nr:DEAD/DEAH box helicase [Sphingomonas abietis]WBO23955.1 DEAD/DEAH box helicase [Sphingomonas abietis]
MKTYGNLTFDRTSKRWTITDLEPHVAIAFKRMFPRVPQTTLVLTMSDTDEIRSDLDWFMNRYPLAHDEGVELRAGVERLAVRAAERDRILLPTWQPGEVPGFRDGKQPYLYQTQAAQIALQNPGLLVGDDVGLGKTITAVAACTMGAPMPAAVIVQAHLANQWARRIEGFTTLRAHVIKTTKPYDLPPADIYVFSYSKVIGWTEVIGTGFFQSVIYDEIQELRHGCGTSKGQVCRIASDKAAFRLGLTATPIYNYGDEIHAVMEFVKPALLGEIHEFMREWCAGSRTVKDPDGLGSFLRDTGYFLRRNEDDPAVSAAQPPANVIDWEVAYDEVAAADEQAIMRSLAMTVMRGDFMEAGRAARELDLKMRQITGIAKARSVAAYVKLLLRDTPRVLLAGWHREVYSIWEQELREFNPVLYTGSETAAGKDRSVKAFTEGDARVMMISLRSGIGLDGLQFHCQDVVFGELDWSPQVHHQIIGRLRRPGQDQQVTAHYLHTNEGSDPVLLETLGIKSDQSRGITEPGIAPRQRFTDDSRIKRLAAYVLGEDAPKMEQAA